MKTLRAAFALAALAWGAASAQTFNPSLPYGTIWDTSPQLCVQGGNNFVCGTGLLVTGSIASYVFTANGPANLAYLNPDTLVGNPTAAYAPAVPITLGSGLAFSGTTLTATGGGGSGTVGAGTSGQLAGYASSGTAVAGQTLTGDCTLTSFAITCLDTNGVAFGNSATQNTGTSGATIPLLNGANTYSALQSFNTLTLAGAVSQASPTTGAGMQASTATYTDSSSTGGTIADYYLNAMDNLTLAASVATTYTRASGWYFPDITCSGNATCTNHYAVKFGGNILASSGVTLQGGVANINVSSNNATNINTGTSNAAIHIGDGSGNNTIGIGNGSGVVTFASPVTISNTTVKLSGLATSSSAQTGTVCSGTGGALTVDTTTTCLLSDGRLKMNVAPLDVGIDEVMKLRPVSYDLKPEANPTGLGRQVGLIAQDVYDVDPRLAAVYQSGPEAGTPSGVRYEQAVALLVRSVQDQQHEIDQLRSQVRSLARKH